MHAITFGIAIVTTPERKSAATMALIAYIGFWSMASIIQDMFLNVVADICPLTVKSYIPASPVLVTASLSRVVASLGIFTMFVEIASSETGAPDGDVTTSNVS